MQGVSVTPHSSFILGWAMHTTGGGGESVVASSIPNQSASHLAHSGDKRCTLVLHSEFTAYERHLYFYISTMQYFVVVNEEGVHCFTEP